MCSHYEPVKDRSQLKDRFKVDDLPDGMMDDMWPGYMGAFVRKHEIADVGDDAANIRYLSQIALE